MHSERSSILEFTANEICRYVCIALLGLAANFSSANPIAITNVRIIDGNGGIPIERGTIVLEGQRIVAIGASSDVHLPAGSRRIDGKGGSVLPGLADMHVHLLGGTDGVGLDILGYQKYLNALLYAGVTTVMSGRWVPPL